MKTCKSSNCFRVILLIVILAAMWGCGSGDSGGGAVPVTSKVFSNGASVSILALGNGNYAVQGENLQGVHGIDLTIGYDGSTMSSPTVTPAELVSGAMFVANTSLPGTIRLAFVSGSVISGSGRIAAVSFATDDGSGSIWLHSAQMIDINGRSL